ncbi:unnamed protein product [Moneuplotes crassus]|uniref:PCI domain-containing protein n=1 Tax=Euplotes crassus TaxID=5936 RepID=A0AAD1ULH6_EUPCR|nr:unnamed protein product [Moneuplotes crassus]
MSDDCDFEYESDGGWSDPEGDEEPDEQEALIINTFYEAEQNKDSNPEEALSKFEKVIELEAEKGTNENTFASLEHIIVISCRLGKLDKALEHHDNLLGMVDQVAKNDKSSAITNILEAVNEAGDSGFKAKFFDKTLAILKDSDNKMWLEIQIKLGKLYLQATEYDKLNDLISELKKTCTSGDDSKGDFSQYNSYLMEVYCLEMQLCAETNDIKRMRDIYPKTEQLSTVINDPRVSGVIKEHGGKLYMIEKQWKKACDELFEAFKCYQEVANSSAKTILKYVILASIISESEINYAETQEAKVYQEDKEIGALMSLRQAYEKDDYNDIFDILSKIKKDDFMNKCLDDFMRNIRLNALVLKVKPYHTVELSYLADELKISEKEVKTLLVELILDQRLDAKIDQSEGKNAKTYLEINSAKKDAISKRKHQAISGWLDSLSDLNEKVILNRS